MRAIQYLLISASALAALAFGADEEVQPIAVYDIFPESQRPALIAAYEKAIESIQKDVAAAEKALPRVYGKTKRTMAKDELDRLRAREEFLRKTNDPPYIGASMRMGPDDVEWKIGTVGTCDFQVHLIEVIDQNTAVLIGYVGGATGKSKHYFVAKGWDTSSWKRHVSLDGPIIVSGTTSYLETNIDGISKQKRCSLLEPFDWDTYKQRALKQQE